MRFAVAILLLLTPITAVEAQQTLHPEAPLFNPNRTTLYTQPDLWRGFNPASGGGWDSKVYLQYMRQGKFNPAHQVSRQRSLHDNGISVALREYVTTRQQQKQLIVAVMGNALEDSRCSAAYRQTAQLGYQLARSGFIVSTGGGPGEMEAANLGAYLSSRNASAIDEAIDIMRRRALQGATPTVCIYANKLAFTNAALDVLKRFPQGVESIGVPTWFYGHEPPNAFATRVAKFFSNAEREDILLATATGGVIFVEGRAGMRQEIFQKAAQNDFVSFCTVVPLVFLGTQQFGDTGLYALVSKYASPPLAVGAGYSASLKLTDDVTDAVAFITATPPSRNSAADPEHACNNMP